MKNAILLAKKQEYVSQKCEKSYFSTKYRINAQNRIRPWWRWDHRHQESASLLWNQKRESVISYCSDFPCCSFRDHSLLYIRWYSDKNSFEFCGVAFHHRIRDVSGFVRLFYILSKNKIFRIFWRHILDFRPIISRFSLIYRTFSVKNLFFVKIKNKRTKPDTSQNAPLKDNSKDYLFS